MTRDKRIICKTPTPGKKTTRIERWKYELVRRAILGVVPRRKPGVEFQKLPGLVKARLTRSEISKLGSVPWYTTAVKLDLEVRGIVQRLPGSGRQRLVRR